ncbi:preprotein translocase subunit YajC [Actinomyces radicidentis]|uniref:preprotein translocase subunit YajC n=1 Tax=Actinomyces radicidentis TaxID=111015 RepID=UPI0028EA7FD9|nr:preprotein translocase subunit YajC [Actinomyces radicidentis]
MLVALVVMLLAFWLMSHFARKQQQKMQAEQERRTEEAMVPGTWVRTRAGFYGTVVEIDGDVVTLATPLGDESLWAKSAIVGAEEPPFASTAAAEDGDAVVVDAADAEVLPAEERVASEYEDGSEPRA